VRTTPLVSVLLAAAWAVACAGRGAAGGAPNPLEAGVLRASQAPIVGLPDILTSDTLAGKRVRVLGWCAAAPGLLAGRRSGAWVLGTPDATIEVRGLVPSDCAPRSLGQTLVLVFAQIVPAAPGGSERLLLRLPE
jgi:hypothetical protein